MAKLHLKFVTPVEVLFEQDVDEVVLPTVNGQITALANHMPLVSVLEPGELLVRTDGEESPVAVAGGVVEVSGNTLTILADNAEHASDIDVAAAEQRAAALAKELEEQKQLDMNTYNQLQRELAAERARLNTAKKWRKM